MTYIEPQYQLPEKAESLHAWRLLGEILARWVSNVVQAFTEALQPVARLIKKVVSVFAHAGIMERPGRHYRVAFRKRAISPKRARIAQRKMAIVL